MRHWDWDGMVEVNRGWLIRLLAGLFAMLGTGPVQRVVWRNVLARLVPMESALRRLIYIMARDLPVVVRPSKACPGSIPAGKGERGERVPVFKLTDPPRIPDPKPRTCSRRNEPRICSLDDWGPRARIPEPRDDDWVDAESLRRRLAAMKAALDDLPAQARRMARWYGRRDRIRATGKHSRLYPFRSGRAPGHREGGKRDVDELLAICHDLALHARMMVEAR